MRTSELTGAALDYAVAQAEGYSAWLADWLHWRAALAYSTDWSKGGPIIERERIDLNWSNHEGTSGEMWDAACEVEKIFGGPTPLIAAMRCFVASKFGAEVDIPEELL